MRTILEGYLDTSGNPTPHMTHRGQRLTIDSSHVSFEAAETALEASKETVEEVMQGGKVAKRKFTTYFIKELAAGAVLAERHGYPSSLFGDRYEWSLKGHFTDNKAFELKSSR